ncbi:phosphoribosylamine--glycine ligase [Muriicola jejuensis]|uniref:Phosphoribosylamine--glycine ligase n=1 Tax=Muriicola jejuensis TaxID=504488 RepID=A0A6P0UBM2_9FLAO|nr:phosphoribosylamine--glycine ligase [Muriicola jejuensis]NER09900.1 phosphoribosylamine--glycine ligase [Muriicola jejuensis]SMP04982.1 phosphoribosylamine--glycine ligase [Muriicola jejuensis]
MNILLLGSGGREHTLAWKLKQSKRLEKLFVAPGNAGTEGVATNLPIDPNDFVAVKAAAIEHKIDMVVVGPEDPLVRGIADYFRQNPDLDHIPVIGPEKKAAALEGSKDFAKQFMMRHGIPTAAYRSFTAETLQEGFNFLGTLNPPYVLKADGLAAGKGVVILDNLDEARAELSRMLLDSKFGEASTTVVIEEFLSGIELSCFVLTDGDHFKILPTAKDYKRIGEGDTGLNTGGMGAISPVPFADGPFMEKVKERIILPTVIGLKKDQLPYKGFIFIGLIKVGEDPYVIEYNVRLGDPETEVVLPRIQNDLVEVFEAVAKGELDRIHLEIDRRCAVTVMAVSGGYPGSYAKGKEIIGLEDVRDSVVFHAGTRNEKGTLVTKGGRVLAVTSYGEDFRKALKDSYRNMEKIRFDGMYYRKDLGFDL